MKMCFSHLVACRTRPPDICAGTASIFWLRCCWALWCGCLSTVASRHSPWRPTSALKPLIRVLKIPLRQHRFAVMHLVRHALDEVVDRPRSLVPARSSSAMAARIAVLLHDDGEG